MLTENNIPNIQQKTFSDLTNPDSGFKLIFDFYVMDKYIIEYDGQQHFEDCYKHGSFERTKKSDFLKNEYCFSHNIPLIRIPYYEEYTIDDLKLETTRFLFTKDKEKEYYRFPR